MKKMLKIILSITALFSLIMSSFPDNLKINAQSEGILTIVSQSNTMTEDRPLTQPQSGIPISGIIYNIWQINDMSSAENDELSAELNKLNNLSIESLTSQFYEPYSTPETDEYGVTKISLALYQSYYVRDMEGVMIPFIISLPSRVGLENINDITVYPKGGLAIEEPGHGKLMKYGLIDEEDTSQTPLEGVKFHLFNDTDINGQYPLQFKGNYEFSSDNLDNTTEILTTDSSGIIYIKNLPAGHYYFKEIQTIPPYELNQEPLYISILPDETTTVTMDNYISNEGGYKFRKISNGASAVPLKGAVFKVLDQDSEPLIIDNKEVLLTSNSDGLFEITNLALGTYYLEEIEAPIVNGVAYQLLDKLIEFTVTGSSYETKRMEIINIPKGETTIPPTGDILIFVILGGAVLLILLGILIYSRSNAEN